MDLVEIKLNEMIKKEKYNLNKELFIYLSDELAQLETFLQNEIYNSLTDKQQIKLSDNINSILINFKAFQLNLLKD